MAVSPFSKLDLEDQEKRERELLELLERLTWLLRYRRPPLISIPILRSTHQIRRVVIGISILSPPKLWDTILFLRHLYLQINMNYPHSRTLPENNPIGNTQTLRGHSEDKIKISKFPQWESPILYTADMSLSGQTSYSPATEIYVIWPTKTKNIRRFAAKRTGLDALLSLKVKGLSSEDDSSFLSY